LSEERDPGFDGYDDRKHYNGRNQNFAPDVVGWNLSFHESDYMPITEFAQTESFKASLGTSAFATNTKSYFDGNIANMSLGIKGFDHIGYSYHFDQLKRLTKRLTFTNLDSTENQWKPLTDTTNYYVNINYDPNGNIDSLTRNAYVGGQLAMDKMKYKYNSGTNQLNKVTDLASDYSSYDDIKQNQPNGNYRYNQIGQLIADTSELIKTIKWDAYHRIKQIEYDANQLGTPKVINFEYDANGHRAKKTVQPGIEETLLKETTIYINDVNGNTQSFYSFVDGTTTCLCKDGKSVDNACYKFFFKQDEIPIYGLGREGTYKINRILYDSTFSKICGDGLPVWFSLGDSLNLILGKKQFELKGHTGNIHATITDRKLQIEGNGGLHNGYKADVMFKADYYPFGMIEPGRNTNPTESRYAFQSMETDASVSGTGNSYTTYFRQYDPRLGRWKTPDPVIHAWESPYVGFGNNPINNIDPHGNSFICAAYAVGQAIAAAAPYIAAVSAAVGAEAASVAPHFSNNTNYLEGNNPGLTEPHSPGMPGDGLKEEQYNPTEKDLIRNLAYQKMTNEIAFQISLELNLDISLNPLVQNIVFDILIKELQIDITKPHFRFSEPGLTFPQLNGNNFDFWFSKKQPRKKSNKIDNVDVENFVLDNIDYIQLAQDVIVKGKNVTPLSATLDFLFSSFDLGKSSTISNQNSLESLIENRAREILNQKTQSGKSVPNYVEIPKN